MKILLPFKFINEPCRLPELSWPYASTPSIGTPAAPELRISGLDTPAWRGPPEAVVTIIPCGIASRLLYVLWKDAKIKAEFFVRVPLGALYCVTLALFWDAGTK